MTTATDELEKLVNRWPASKIDDLMPLRCSVTFTSSLPSSGANSMNRLAVPLRLCS